MEALKIWAPENPAHVTKPGIKFELWRKGQKFDGTPIDEKVNEFTTTAGQDSEKEFDKTANGIDLAKYDPGVFKGRRNLRE